MINVLSDYLMSIIIKINKLINSVITINLTVVYSYIFSIIVFKFRILTTFFTSISQYVFEFVHHKTDI